MTFPITDFSLKIAENTADINIPVWLVVVICVVIFLASTVIFGFMSYKIKLKKLKNKTDSNDENQGG